MRYVHLPIGYDGVHPDQARAIAKAIEELPGPIYLHCHHGKHRSAAAAAVGCVLNGSIRPEQAEVVLQTFGTGANYKGLWRDAREAKPLSAEELAAVKVTYVEAAKIDDVADAMVDVDQRWDEIKAVKAAGWKTPVDHPDLDPAHVALMVQEHFTEIGRMPDTAKRPVEFRKFLAEGERGADALRGALAAKPVDTATADAAFQRTSAACAACHKSFRDQIQSHD
jgi:hypothetical protein